MEILNLSYTTNQCVTQESTKRTSCSACWFTKFIFIFWNQVSQPWPRRGSCGMHISLCSGGGTVKDTWVCHSDWLKARTHDSVWVNGSVPRAFSRTVGKEMHYGIHKLVACKPFLFCSIWKEPETAGNSEENAAIQPPTPCLNIWVQPCLKLATPLDFVATGAS